MAVESSEDGDKRPDRCTFPINFVADLSVHVDHIAMARASRELKAAESIDLLLFANSSRSNQ
jgi:hypothetical protein